MKIKVLSFNQRWQLEEITRDTNPIQIFKNHSCGRYVLTELRQEFQYPPDHPSVDWSDDNDTFWIIAVLSATQDRRILRKWKRQLGRGRRWF